jgi:HK97 family phage prohead protease
MPYFISNHADGCAGWATVKHDNSVITCHKTKKQAIDHMVALSIAEGIEPGGKLKVDNRRNMATEETTITFTKQELAKRLSDLLGDVVVFKFMAHGFHWNVRGVDFATFHEFFGEIYEDADNAIDPIAENIRKLGYDAPFSLQQFIEPNDVVPTNLNDSVSMSRSLYQGNADVLECIVAALAVANELGEQGIVNFLAERQDMHSKWEWQLRAIVGDDFANANQQDVEAEWETIEDEADVADMAEDAVVEKNSAKDKWVKAAERIALRFAPLTETPMPESRGNKIETRVSHADIELREVQGSNGMTFEGYAAVFNSPSMPIGGQFTEYVAPGAFKRSLQARNDIKLLWNHDTGQVLGSTRAGTLTLVEDSRGLKAIAQLPDTQLGRDTATLLKRGDVANMSFGFSVPAKGDAWNEDGSVRTLNSVRLHEVSIVSFPAYAATTASVRSIDQDVLADSLFKLEQGQELSADEAIVVKSVIDKLTEDIQEAPAEAILDLKQKKLDLLSKRI